MTNFFMSRWCIFVGGPRKESMFPKKFTDQDIYETDNSKSSLNQVGINVGG